MNEEFAPSRRSVMKGVAILGAATLAGGCALSGEKANADTHGSNASTTDESTQYGFLVRTDRCVDCKSCVIACREANKTPEGAPSRRKVERYETSEGKHVFISTSCMQCADPACMHVCPAGAISKGAGGIVTVDHERCIGCKYCYQACPFGVPHYEASLGMDKCDCCQEAGVALGSTPNCVNACKFRALSYGPIEELEKASGGQAKRIECETGPSMLIQ